MLEKLTALSQKAFNIQAQILLSLIYFLILPIFVLLFKLIRTPKNDHKKTAWEDWVIKSETLEDLKRQF